MNSSDDDTHVSLIEVVRTIPRTGCALVLCGLLGLLTSPAAQSSMAGSVRDRLDSYYNVAAFSRPPADTYGSAPGTLTYRGPGLSNADLTLGKRFFIGEKDAVELRLDAFNAFNGRSLRCPQRLLRGVLRSDRSPATPAATRLARSRLPCATISEEAGSSRVLERRVQSTLMASTLSVSLVSVPVTRALIDFEVFPLFQ